METVSLVNTHKIYKYSLPETGEEINKKKLLKKNEEISTQDYYYYESNEDELIKLITAKENNSELENKIIFLCSNHPFAKKVRKKDYLLLPKQTVLLEEGEDSYTVGYTCEKLPFEGITLNQIFQKENIEKYHIDIGILYEIAIHLMEILKDLAMDDIYPGLLDLGSIVVPKENPTLDMKIIHVERFQYLRYEQSFPWYPCDERIFDEEVVLFHELTQWKANIKLLYKVLVAAEKENIKIPPRDSWEYSTIFWNILSPSWKERFLSIQTEEKIEYREVISELKQILVEEKKYDRTNIGKIEEEKEAEQRREEMRTIFVLLRGEEQSLKEISKELYLLMEKLEEDNEYRRKLSFVYGNKYIYAREFSYYKKGFRVQLQNKIKNYSFGEAILIAADLMEEELKKEEAKAEFYILVDGKIRKDAMFLYAVEKLKKLLENNKIQLSIIPIRECEGEAYGMLKRLNKIGFL
ncbi:MAG: hypothetical protein ACI4F9_01470 [Lachnospiraceae bacterium]